MNGYLEFSVIIKGHQLHGGCLIFCLKWNHIDGLVQEIRNSSTVAIELRLSCTNPLIYDFIQPFSGQWVRSICFFVITCTSLWPGDAIWQNRSGSKLAQVLQHLCKSNFTGNSLGVYPWYEFENYKFKITAQSLRCQWIKFWCLYLCGPYPLLTWNIWFISSF